MRQVRVIYLEDIDEAAGLAIAQKEGFIFLAASKSFKPLERTLYRDVDMIADAAYRLIAYEAAPAETVSAEAVPA